MSARILIVDNDADVASVLTDLLVARGLTVVHAADGAEGLARMQASLEPEGEPIDLVLLDLRMPVLGGRELLDRLHAGLDARAEDAPGAPAPHVPGILVLSGFIDHADRAALDEDPFVAQVFKKPFDFLELLGAIDAQLAQRAAAATPEQAEAPVADEGREAGSCG